LIHARRSVGGRFSSFWDAPAVDVVARTSSTLPLLMVCVYSFFMLWQAAKQLAAQQDAVAAMEEAAEGEQQQGPDPGTQFLKLKTMKVQRAR
jgi:hypothetical protein